MQIGKYKLTSGLKYRDLIERGFEGDELLKEYDKKGGAIFKDGVKIENGVVSNELNKKNDTKDKKRSRSSRTSN